MGKSDWENVSKAAGVIAVVATIVKFIAKALAA